MKAAHIVASAAIGIVLATPAALARAGANPPAPPSPGIASPQKGAQSIPVDQLPAAVTSAVEKTYPKSTIVSAAKVDRGGQVRYELSVKPSGAAQPIAVMASAA